MTTATQPPLPLVYLARHGETDWSVSQRHTGLTDLPLTPQGENNARRLGAQLAGIAFARILTSPLQRAARTCELAGFGERASVVADLVEWNYGAYEGKTTAEIHRLRPGWELFRDGCPDGETAADVGRRADRIIAHLRQMEGTLLLFSHAHLLRVLGARWLGLEPAGGRFFVLGAAGLSILGYEHGRPEEPVIRLWNDLSACAGSAGR